jgi:hypothetical protein
MGKKTTKLQATKYGEEILVILLLLLLLLLLLFLVG